jgi:glycosyltransferase involved in cell wall biosynthesis
MRVTLLHLDLGIGGAEKLIVNIACLLKERGHEVRLLTTHHDPTHCFAETKPKSGILHSCIEVYGDWLPRHIFGKGTAICAIFRMIYLSLVTISKYPAHIVIIDGVSAPIPILKIANFSTLFYCHFPDKLLCTERSSLLKRVYRFFIDDLEELTTSCADTIVVNSKYTSEMFRHSFPTLGEIYKPEVLYPSVPCEDAVNCDSNDSSIDYIRNSDLVFVSLNRFERKKNIALAVQAISILNNEYLKKNDADSTRARVLLVIAGGYDKHLDENVKVFKELHELCQNMSIPVQTNLDNSGDALCTDRNVDDESPVTTIFRTSIGENERIALFKRASAVIYTPENEHFGIVPLEAMKFGTPVIACNSGGPCETVVDGTTGFLCESNADHFASAIRRFIDDPSLSERLGAAGRLRVHERFTAVPMGNKLEVLLESMRTVRKSPHPELKNATRIEKSCLISLSFTLSVLLFFGALFVFIIAIFLERI